MKRHEASPWLMRGLYLFTITLMIGPTVDLVSTVWPLRFSDLTWRYGFLGLTAGYLSTPLLGAVLLGLVGWWDRRPGLVKGVGVAMCLASGIVLAMAAVFMLDLLQLRGLREADVQGAVMVGGMIQELKYAMSALVLALFGVGALRTARHITP